MSDRSCPDCGNQLCVCKLMSDTKKPREFWIKHIEDNVNGSGDRVFRQNVGTDSIHTIEYSAYDDLLYQANRLASILYIRLDEYRGPASRALETFEQFKKEAGLE